MIESGEKQIPLFWGGTETQTQVMSILNEETARQKLRLDGQTLTHAPKECSNTNEGAPREFKQPLTHETIMHETISNSTNPSFASAQDEWQNTPKTNAVVCGAENSQNQCTNICNDACLDCPNFDQSDIENVVDDEIVKYELIENFDEPDSPQCQNCKYKNVFYQEKNLDEAKEQLAKIAHIQATDNSQNVQYDTKNKQSSPRIVQDSDNILQDNLQNDSSANDTTSGIVNENDLQNAEPYYYGLIKAQYDDMFSKYPIFAPLTNIIENSKWIEVEGIDDPYIMGIIYDDGKPKYLCYGVVQEKKQSPPIEIADSSQWVPFDVTNEFGSGVWIMYQSADNGETIKVEVI